jgi:hypothetical protein
MRFPEMDAARPRPELCGNINGAWLRAAPIADVAEAAAGSVRREIANRAIRIAVGESYDLIATPRRLRCRALACSRCLAQHGGARIGAGVAAGAPARAGLRSALAHVLTVVRAPVQAVRLRAR